MARTADVTAFHAIEQVAAALRGFDHDARRALSDLESEIRRFVDWLESEQAYYWRNQVRRRWEAVAEARAQLERCRAVTVAGHRSACRDEKIALDTAQRRVRVAEQKVKDLRAWQTKFQQELHEFHGRVQALASWLDIDLPRSLAAIGRMQTALDAYTRIEPTGSAALADVIPESDPPTPAEPIDVTQELEANGT